MSDFSIGATVRLKSGGPLMTVGDISDYSEAGDGLSVKCDWTDKAEKPQSITYRREQLVLDDGSAGGFFSI